jgi:hypothetical protein
MLISLSLAEIDEVWVFMGDHVGEYYNDCVLGTMLCTPRILLPLSSACNVSVEAAVFFEMFMVTRLYGVGDVW